MRAGGGRGAGRSVVWLTVNAVLTEGKVLLGLRRTWLWIFQVVGVRFDLPSQASGFYIRCDHNCDGTANMSDAIRGLNQLFIDSGSRLAAWKSRTATLTAARTCPTGFTS